MSRVLISLSAVILVFAALQVAKLQADTPNFHRSQLPRRYVPSGERIYKDYCATCHGPDGKGRGPMSPYLNRQPPDLTILSKNHGGNFPVEYVTSVLRFGIGLPPHGTSDMPVWGPIFQEIENYNEAAVRQRIQNLCKYLESIQDGKLLS